MFPFNRSLWAVLAALAVAATPVLFHSAHVAERSSETVEFAESARVQLSELDPGGVPEIFIADRSGAELTGAVPTPIRG